MSPFVSHPRTCLIRHLPDPEGPPIHFDWLIEPIGGEDRAREPDVRDVLAWRVGIRPDRLEIGQEVDLDPIAPHRRIWLDRPVGRFHDLRAPLGRAMVVRRGRILRGPAPPDPHLELAVSWSESTDVHHLRIRWEPGRLPRLRRTSSPPGDPPLHGDRSC